MNSVKQAIILAGGVGERLRPLTHTMPKPMVPVNGRPYLEYLVRLLKKNGISEIILLVGYLHEKIIEHFGDGSDFGIKIKYSIGDVSFETGKRIKDAEKLIQERFLLMYCDNYWPLDLKKLTEFYDRNKTAASVTIYTNKDGITRNNMYVDSAGYVVKYDKSRKDENLNGVEIGFFIMDKSILDLMPDTNFSFEKEILPKLIEKRQLSGYLTDHRYYSIGSPERMAVAEKFLQPKKIIFLDRDGVINKKAKKAEYIRSWSEFEFLPGSIDAMKMLSRSGYRIFVITNQAGISRGAMTEDDLKVIHSNLKSELEKKGVRIEKIYYCPHGWDDGCECRKPKPGMLFQAAREYDLDLSESIFIGDDKRDLEAGLAAECRTLLVGPGESLLKLVKKKITDGEVLVR